MEAIRVVVEAFYYVNKYKGVFAKALAWPFVAILLLDAAEGDGVFNYVNSFIAIGVHGIFAITTHRIVLLGPDSVPKWGIITWTKRETLFALYLIALGLLIIPLPFLSSITTLGASLAGLVVCWLFIRFSLVFPGVAVDKGVTFALSWELTKGRQILMFVVLLVFPLLLIIPMVIMVMLVDSFFLSSFISTLLIVFNVAVLSVAYKLIATDKYSH
jgi:hypothetical protein